MGRRSNIRSNNRPISRASGPRFARRRPKPDRRRALELLAASRDGCTEAIMIARGFAVDMLADLIRHGLTTARIKRVVAAGRSMLSACGSRTPIGERSGARNDDAVLRTISDGSKLFAER
jgi:hypothetical protein